MKITIDNLELAQFTREDTPHLYDIRNHESVRACMSHSAPFSYEAHERWVRRNLIDGRGFLMFLVRLRQEEPIGYTLLRRHGADTAEVGAAFKEATKHPVVPFVATVATFHLAFCHFHLAALISYCLPTNERALAVNQALALTEIESDKPGELKMRVTREACLANPNYIKVFNRMKSKLVITGDTSGVW
jgi:RimJ/RimL family protein N-acetyltransferase